MSPPLIVSPPIPSSRRIARSSRTMPAAVLVRPGAFEIREVSIPEPGPRQVRIKLEGCGISTSDVPAWEGRPGSHYPLQAGAPGHEGWGRIDAVGKEVAGLVCGERVGMLSRSAYAAYDLAEANQLVRLPESLDEVPVPAEPLGCVVNVFRRSCINRGDKVAIVGVGFMGALLTQLATLAEAKVIAIGRRPYALGLARELGAAHTIAVEHPQDHEQVIDEVKRITEGALCDIVIEATGKLAPLNLAAELARERGRLVVAGYHQDGPRHVNMQLWNWRGLDVINAHERAPTLQLEGMREAVAAVNHGLLTPTRLYTHRFELERLDEGLRLCVERPSGFMKAIIQF